MSIGSEGKNWYVRLYCNACAGRGWTDKAVTFSILYLPFTFSKPFCREAYVIHITLLLDSVSPFIKRLKGPFQAPGKSEHGNQVSSGRIQLFSHKITFSPSSISFVGKAQRKVKSQVAERWQNICMAIPSTLKRRFLLGIAGEIRHKEDSDSPRF